MIFNDIFNIVWIKLNVSLKIIFVDIYKCILKLNSKKGYVEWSKLIYVDIYVILKIIIRGYVSVKELRMCLLFFLEKLGYLIGLFEFMCRYKCL